MRCPKCNADDYYLGFDTRPDEGECVNRECSLYNEDHSKAVLGEEDTLPGTRARLGAVGMCTMEAQIVHIDRRSGQVTLQLECPEDIVHVSTGDAFLSVEARARDALKVLNDEGVIIKPGSGHIVYADGVHFGGPGVFAHGGFSPTGAPTAHNVINTGYEDIVLFVDDKNRIWAGTVDEVAYQLQLEGFE